jgi:cephalosporin-C deacetylase-like acetyl esterase
MQTALYFDPVNFASRITSPVLAGFGFIDTTSPPAGVWTTLNQIPVPTEPLPMIESDHNNPAGSHAGNTGQFTEWRAIQAHRSEVVRRSHSRRSDTGLIFSGCARVTADS